MWSGRNQTSNCPEPLRVSVCSTHDSGGGDGFDDEPDPLVCAEAAGPAESPRVDASAAKARANRRCATSKGTFIRAGCGRGAWDRMLSIADTCQGPSRRMRCGSFIGLCSPARTSNSQSNRFDRRRACRAASRWHGKVRCSWVGPSWIRGAGHRSPLVFAQADRHWRAGMTRDRPQQGEGFFGVPRRLGMESLVDPVNPPIERIVDVGVREDMDAWRQASHPQPIAAMDDPQRIGIGADDVATGVISRSKLLRRRLGGCRGGTRSSKSLTSRPRLRGATGTLLLGRLVTATINRVALMPSQVPPAVGSRPATKGAGPAEGRDRCRRGHTLLLDWRRE